MSATLESELIELINSIVTFEHIENSYVNSGDVELDDSLDNTRESASDIDIIENNISNKLSIPELSDTNKSQFSSNDMVNEDTCESKNEYISEESVTSVSKPASSFANFKNPPKVVGRERPKKQKYISSVEKEQKREGSSTRRSYKCGTCGKAGHNSVFHKKR
ncbi:24492_t:CDS:2 [Gigaspora margarita]|uniref:24492_t:CDS:1 n=1 Tax=Gigaspora margarita TaxID=4874 RepID=A0ABN7VQJ9_GIGMA|nr:24492_t:CDS:2 [Gigaspora margarita]